MRVLVTGATGYIGGRLVPELLEAGHEVRCLARSPERLRDHPWRADVEVVQGDVLERTSLDAALDGVDVAYYLVHAMGGGPSFAQLDRESAQTFADAACSAGVERIVYLGGLTPQGEQLSPHLRSRAQVGEIFLAASVPAVVLKAAIILGSGSASFEMLRYLTERLPVMTTPRWVSNRIQPIAVRDVLRLLVKSASLPEDVNRAFDIGGHDVFTYTEMIQRFARVASIPKRMIIPLPVLSPGLSSLWVGTITPVPGSIARPLVESLRHEVVCREDDLADLLDDHERLSFDEAVRLALARIREARVATRWSSAAWPTAPSDPLPTDPDWAGGSLYEDKRERVVAASRDTLWRVIEGIGGDNGWYSWPLAWAARGWLDRLSGGVGLRRGRRDPTRLRNGESLDFWRVEAIERGSLLRLRAEMRLPGLAWFELRAAERDGATVYSQRALFHPRGLGGHLYWWGVTPFHGIIFGSMARNIAAKAEHEENVRKESARTGDGKPGQQRGTPAIQK
ncbi:SDR family oxidoreductase [Nocardiopsis ansamitocini]|uniref:NAD(P)-dependent oxidoreductase n=1 Tax=Nocardiopsis ansamitocini TaxID=1670832 RepID=A0A9W6UIA4_9ACTN|nr:SDR family oxidoreductase [Nocardiopsis ansamitocini]GLU49741.1 NAD(P)-dependent oxidoreductase [Nocardiopsis ansamitocini]